MAQRTIPNDEFFMQEALREARNGAEQDEVPIGAIIIDEHGTIIARAYNRVERELCQLAHAELLAIRQATTVLQDWRLERCWMYVTLEPCSMCLYALIQSRIAGVVYGAESPVFGFHLDIEDNLAVYKKTTIVKGVCAQEAGALLKQFFNQKRKLRRE